VPKATLLQDLSYQIRKDPVGEAREVGTRATEEEWRPQSKAVTRHPTVKRLLLRDTLAV
jgi:hypothetical protein